MSEQPNGLHHIVIPEFVFGLGARHLVPAFLRNFDARKVLVVTDRGVTDAGWTGQVLHDLDDTGTGWTVFDDVSANTPSTQVAEGARRYRDADCEAIVAVGGGSVMDCAKAIGIIASNGGDILDYRGVDTVEEPTPPLICLSTTTTSADVSQFAIVSDSDVHRKFAIISKAIVPDVSLLDPIVYTTLPPHLTSLCGIDFASQAIEGYVSNAHSPLTDLLALDAVRLAFSTLPLAYGEPEDLGYRNTLMFGNLEAGIAFSNASLGMVHATAHAVGGLTDAHHGACIAAMLPAVIEFNHPAAPERFAAIADAMGTPVLGMPEPVARTRIIEGIRGLEDGLGAATTLTGLGLDRSDIPWLVEQTLADPTLVTNPRPATAEDIEGVYERAF